MVRRWTQLPAIYGNMCRNNFWQMKIVDGSSRRQRWQTAIKMHENSDKYITLCLCTLWKCTIVISCIRWKGQSQEDNEKFRWPCGEIQLHHMLASQHQASGTEDTPILSFQFVCFIAFIDDSRVSELHKSIETKYEKRKKKTSETQHGLGRTLTWKPPMRILGRIFSQFNAILYRIHSTC